MLHFDPALFAVNTQSLGAKLEIYEFFPDKKLTFPER